MITWAAAQVSKSPFSHASMEHTKLTGKVYLISEIMIKFQNIHECSKQPQIHITKILRTESDIWPTTKVST